MENASFMGYESLFAVRLRDLVGQKNISKQQLADEIGVSRQAVSQYCDGSTIPNAEKLLRIAEYFNVSLDYLVGRTENVTIDEELKFVSAYTGLNEDAAEALHNWAVESKLEWLPTSNEFLNMIIANDDIVKLCRSAITYRSQIKQLSHKLHNWKNNLDEFVNQHPVNNKQIQTEYNDVIEISEDINHNWNDLIALEVDIERFRKQIDFEVFNATSFLKALFEDFAEKEYESIADLEKYYHNNRSIASLWR